LLSPKATTEVTVRNVVNSLNLENFALVRAVFISTIQNPFARARKGRKWSLLSIALRHYSIHIKVSPAKEPALNKIWASYLDFLALSNAGTCTA
jgi:hypothetical protein